jgi:maltooligosyltrehalose trehalohydrolase
VEVVLGADRDRVCPLAPESDGFFSGQVTQAWAGDRYWYRLDGKDDFPDPASRYQPRGPHGPSQIVDPHSFEWSDSNWRGVSLRGQVIYEMHIGTFTPEGTWHAAQRQLPLLAETGITVLEVMPIADLPGEFGWGYDGVNLYAPTRMYGEPDDVRRFVDIAHSLGIGVILDVVYNHIGPDGNYLKEFAKEYFSQRYTTEWGEAINFDGERAGPVRDYFASNAAYWIEEFHFDGLRLDATQQIYDCSADHIMAVINRRVREAAQGRETIIVAENEPQHPKLIRPDGGGGHGLDGLWNDDLHHSAHVALTSRNEAYYTDYLGKPQEFISAAKWGYLFQGQRYKWQEARRGRPALDVSPEKFIAFLDNHDQVANSCQGQRIHRLTSPGRFRSMTAFMLLAPSTPMLFQGQEFAASSPFFYFADHTPELAALVKNGREEFLKQFPSLALPQSQEQLRDPGDPKTFEDCKLDFTEREKHAETFNLHRDLLRLRREDAAFRAQQPRGVDGAVLGDQAFLLRFFVPGDNDRLLVVNLGRDLHLDPAPEPLLAPPEDMRWELLWSSEEMQYGGGGTPPVDTDTNWHFPGESALVLKGVLAPQEHPSEIPTEPLLALKGKGDNPSAAT